MLKLSSDDGNNKIADRIFFVPEPVIEICYCRDLWNQLSTDSTHVTDMLAGSWLSGGFSYFCQLWPNY